MVVFSLFLFLFSWLLLCCACFTFSVVTARLAAHAGGQELLDRVAEQQEGVQADMGQKMESFLKTRGKGKAGARKK